MFVVFSQMAALIACGVAWRLIKPMGIDADTGRRSLTGLVYIMLLPALVLHVLWKAPLGIETPKLALSAAIGIVFALIASMLIYRAAKTPRAKAGALILAAAFPNATYMGLAVLEQLLGNDARSIAIQYDLFACTPILLTVGILIAQAYGGSTKKENPLVGLLKVPPLWAALIAVILNVTNTPMPIWLDQWLGQLAVAVVPLMLVALGMGLQWGTTNRKDILLLTPVLVIQLALMPVVVYYSALGLGLKGDMLTGALLEAAMPSMVLGMVLCDRYGLKTELYALVVTLSTVLSLFTIPLWFAWMT